MALGDGFQNYHLKSRKKQENGMSEDGWGKKCGVVKGPNNIE